MTVDHTWSLAITIDELERVCNGDDELDDLILGKLDRMQKEMHRELGEMVKENDQELAKRFEKNARKPHPLIAADDPTPDEHARYLRERDELCGGRVTGTREALQLRSQIEPKLKVDVGELRVLEGADEDRLRTGQWGGERVVDMDQIEPEEPVDPSRSETFIKVQHDEIQYLRDCVRVGVAAAKRLKELEGSTTYAELRVEQQGLTVDAEATTEKSS